MYYNSTIHSIYIYSQVLLYYSTNSLKPNNKLWYLYFEILISNPNTHNTYYMLLILGNFHFNKINNCCNELSIINLKVLISDFVRS